MEALVLNVESLPLPIREKLNTRKVSVQERDGAVILLPVQEGSGLLGIAANDNLTVDIFNTYKKEDKELDK